MLVQASCCLSAPGALEASPFLHAQHWLARLEFTVWHGRCGAEPSPLCDPLVMIVGVDEDLSSGWLGSAILGCREED